MLAARAWATENTFERVQGWLKRESVEAGEGLLICPCASIHTLGLRFAIDAVFLDRKGRVLKVVHRAEPSRLVWGPWRGTLLPFSVQVLELPAGSAEAAGLSSGRQLVFEARSEAL
ncbi:MAG TPA: DUF192 domain-containing protein [bacterium]|nr:DUF192 domain-containing protein [bacterium]